MNQAYDIKITFKLPVYKLILSEVFLKKLKAPLKAKVVLKEVSEENRYKDLVYASKWISIIYHENHFENRFWKRNNIEFSNFIFEYFNYLFRNFGTIDDNEFLLKIGYISKKGTKLYFLFNQINSIIFLKEAFAKATKKIYDYKSGELSSIKEIKKAFKLPTKEVYYEYKNDKWQIINLLFNAGKYHHDNIAKDIYDNRIAKPHILVNKVHLNENIKYKALWKLEVNNKIFIRVKPNDIALYSNIAMKNLRHAKEIYENENSVLWKYIQSPEDERELLDYYELIITSIILAYSSIEVLINSLIPNYYFHKRKVKNNKTGRLITKKYSKIDIERWFTMNDKMNIILPEALLISLPNQQKWWYRFSKLHEIRNKIVHAVKSKSNERYSELLEKEIFEIVESHIEIIKYFGNWATDNRHYLLNELPYGFGYDDIMPFLLRSKDYDEMQKERKGIK